MIYRKRGRPPKPKEPVITKELAAKHKANLTQEPIDLLLLCGVINKPLHMSAMEINRLYRICAGRKVGIGSNFPTIDHKKYRPIPDSTLRKLVAKYQTSINMLREQKLGDAIINLCIYSVWPYYLKWKINKEPYIPHLIERETADIKNGLTILAKYYGY
jgi:hypothetical protein